MSESSSAGRCASSKSLMWMMVALFAGFGVMLAGGLFLANHLARTMGLAAASGTKNTVRTPIGAFRMGNSGSGRTRTAGVYLHRTHLPYYLATTPPATRWPTPKVASG